VQFVDNHPRQAFVQFVQFVDNVPRQAFVQFVQFVDNIPRQASRQFADYPFSLRGRYFGIGGCIVCCIGGFISGVFSASAVL
jgi:hypothetical protein